jgi:hypothetical protein
MPQYEDEDYAVYDKKKKPSINMNNGYTPLMCLNTFSADWAIKCLVTKKCDLRPYKNMKGEGNIFKIELADD